MVSTDQWRVLDRRYDLYANLSWLKVCLCVFAAVYALYQAACIA